MASNAWYSGSSANRGPQYPNSQPGAAADSVQDAHRLLAVYPFASATPSTHAARHLGGLAVPAMGPSYMQSHNPKSHNYPHPPTHPASYSQYAAEINHLQSQQASTTSGYWSDTRSDALRYLGDQSSHSYINYQPHGRTWTYPSQPTHTSNAFATSVFQHTMPSLSYPTPPPGIRSSSSSLANALVERPSQSRSHNYDSRDSAAFFNNFLDKSSRELEKAQTVKYAAVKQESEWKESLSTSSPDPLALEPPPPLTPQKRKPVEQIQSPVIKRAQGLQRTTAPPAQPTPSSSPSTSLATNSSMSHTPVSTVRKRKMQAYVELPVLSRQSTTPTSSKRATLKTPSKKAKVRMEHDDDDDDLGGYGSEGDDVQPRKTSLTMVDVARTSAKRTGDRDDRGPVEKLVTLLEDIFEAEDGLPADVELDSLPIEFFSRLSFDASRPQLHPNMIRKLAKHVAQAARPVKRLRGHSGLPNTPAKTRTRLESIADIDASTISRILKVLERTVRAGEDLDPFSNKLRSGSTGIRSVTSSPVKKRNAKGGKKQDIQPSRRSKSQTPRDDEDDTGDGAGRPEAAAPSEATRDLNLEELTRQLDMARNSILAADCSIAILGSDRLSKQVYSEELITTCLAAIKNQLNRIIYPFIEFSPGTPQADPTLVFLAKGSYQSQSHRRQLAEIFQSLSSVLPRINDLISTDAVTMSDAVVIQAVYIAIGPFFVLDSGEEEKGKGRKENLVLSTFGQSAMRGLRLNALSLIRSIFANHEDQRSWIIEEILTSLIKLSETKQKAGQFRLRDGRSIRTVSALLLQLVQTSAHGIRDEARRLTKSRQQLLGAQRQEGSNSATPQAFLSENDSEEIRLYLSGLESATKAAKTIVVFLTQRSGKGKVTKNSNEAEYRNILDNLISDVLAVLFWPEWPAASLLLSIICKFMVASLDDIKHTSHNAKDNDNNAARNVALDHLGIIAARLRGSMLKFQGNKDSALRPLDEILPSANLKQLSKLVQAHHDISAHLSKRSSEDQAYDSARDLTAVTWGQELAVALKQCDTVLDDTQGGSNSVSADQPRLLLFGSKVKNALRDVWKEAGADVFDLGSEGDVARTDRLSEEIGTVQDLRNLFQPILTVILLALDAPPVFMRTKALRALGQIVTSDASILSAPNVRRGIESHLLDSSPAVRDAAVELIGKYLIDSPEVAGDYYRKIADRIADTGLGVRKRVIKLLKSFYSVSDEFERRVDICTRLVLRMYDEDEGVRDLAVKTIEELWFTSSPIGVSIQRQQDVVATVAGDKAQLLGKVAVIMSVSGSFKDRQSPLEDLLHKLMASKEDAEASSLHERYSEICEVLIDGLVDASDLPGFTVINCVRTIYLFTSAYPAILTGAHASTLLPYLKNASTPDEQTTSDYLLKIFRVSIPQMPKTAAKFGAELQSALQPMILKPSAAGGISALQETVACMCAVVTHLTHDFRLLTGLLKSCNRSLRKSTPRREGDALPMQEVRALTMLIFIVALLVENCNFDRLRGEKPELAPDLDDVTKGSITEHVYTSLLTLYQKYTEPVLRDRILQCLGFLFRAQPTLMTVESSAMIMDAIFASAQEESRARLLKIMQEFLVSEASKHSAKTKQGTTGATDVDMEELVGNTDGFADSGVSSAIVQRYLDPILQAVLSQHSQTQAAAIDILSFTIKQGLAHPLQSFPVVIALETSPSPTLSSRANALHAILHNKHSSLLNSRYVISARSSFEYQKKLTTGPVQGYNPSRNSPTALLQQWYTLVREKRPSRIDFLRSLLRVFELKSDHACTQDDVEFARYMAENFATLDYKTQEEVLVVTKSLTNVLSTVGMQLIESLSPSHLLAQLHAPLHPQQPSNDDQEMRNVEISQEQSQVQPSDTLANDHSVPDVARSLEKMPLLRSSIIVSIVMLLRAYLKTSYGITEDKCLKWVIGKKNAQGDRAAIRRHSTPLTWERLPFAVRPLLTTEDMTAQRDTFLQVWTDDGVSGEPEEDFE